MWELDYKESWVLKRWCFWTVVLEKTLESPLGCKEIQPINPKGNESWLFIGRTDTKAESFGHLMRRTDWERSWCWERLKAGGGDGDRRQEGWMVSPTQWTSIWVSSGSWWWTGKPVMLQSLGLQRVGDNWGTELNWINNNVELPSMYNFIIYICSLMKWLIKIIVQFLLACF